MDNKKKFTKCASKTFFVRQFFFIFEIDTPDTLLFASLLKYQDLDHYRQHDEIISRKALRLIEY